jgi:hypothetical protein
MPFDSVLLVDRLSVKKHICPAQRSNDSIIRNKLIERFGDKGTKDNPGHTYGLKSHAWQAFALGIYCQDKLRIEAK